MSKHDKQLGGNATSANIDITHSFSRAQANQYGVHGAILLRYVINRIRSSTNIRDGKRWFYDSVADLKEHYPYLSQTTVNNARLTLIEDKGPLITANYNEWRRDKTTWYAVRDDRTLKSPEDDLLYFKVWEANAYGILEAVILSNLRYWIEEKQKENTQYQYHPMSPRKLEEVFQGAFSRNSIDRALKHLVKDGVLIPKAPEHANDPISYSFAGPEDETGGGSTENEVAQPRTGSPKIKVVAHPRTPLAQPRKYPAQVRTKVAHPRTTIPINNSLEDSSLKDCLEVRLKEDRFKASSAGGSSQTHTDAAHSDSSLNASLGASDQSGYNLFHEPIVNPPVTDSPSNSLPSVRFSESIVGSPSSQSVPNGFPESIAQLDSVASR